MPEKKIDFHCGDCGCDRGGVIDLSEKNPILRCFECDAKRKGNNGKAERR